MMRPRGITQLCVEGGDIRCRLLPRFFKGSQRLTEGPSFSDLIVTLESRRKRGQEDATPQKAERLNAH